MKKILFIIILISLGFEIFGQNSGSINGDFQVIGQTYKQDTLIGANATPEYLLMNSYANFYYHNGGFTAGMRYEGYFNTLQGYNEKNDGFGFPYKFLQYQNEKIDITVGNFYEQFGNGLVLRAYEDKNIGYDNAFDGIRFKFQPYSGVYLTALVGRQRLSFSKNNLGFSNVVNKGLVRGVDIELSPNEIFSKLATSSHQLLLGYSFVSKYQKSEPQYVNINDTTSVLLDLPENVAAMSFRLNYNFKNFGFSGEYAYKSQDPSADNNFIYKDGEALFMNFTYSRSGLGILLSLLHIDNFSFRSDRNAAINDLNINYIPDITKNHAYSFAAMYPYVSRNIGERGIAVEISKNFKRKSALGGHYGMNIVLNYSRMYDLYRLPIADSIPIGQKGTLGYKTDWTKFGDLLYQDISVKLTKKVSKSFKFIALYQNLFFNYAVLRGEPGYEPVKANTFALDMTYKFDRKNALNVIMQGLFSKQDMGSWLAGLAEYSISPHWFFTVSDEYNYDNPNPYKEAHYYNFSIAYKFSSTRIQIGYGRQRSGVICIGGVCREVPAANGFNFTISSSF